MPSLGICSPCGFLWRTVPGVMLHIVADTAISIFLHQRISPVRILRLPILFRICSNFNTVQMQIISAIFFCVSPKPNSLAFWLVHIARAGSVIIFSEACVLNKLKTNYRVSGQTSFFIRMRELRFAVIFVILLISLSQQAYFWELSFLLSIQSIIAFQR